MNPLPASRTGGAPRARARWARRGLALAAVGTVAATVFFWPATPPVPAVVSQGAPVRIEPAATSRPGASDPAGGSVYAGQSASPPAAASMAADRYRLVGVMASAGAGAGRGTAAGGSDGVALIAVGGGPARTFQVGAVVEDDTLLLEVSAFGATLGPRDRSATISLQVASAPAQAPEAMATRATGPEASWHGSVDAPSLVSEDDLRKLGARHPPLRQQSVPAPPVPADSATEPDDGRWSAPTEQ